MSETLKKIFDPNAKWGVPGAVSADKVVRGPWQGEAKASTEEEQQTMGGLVWLDQVERTPPKFTVQNLIPADSLVAIFGQPKHGKSFVAIDLAACVATGTPYHGRKVEQGLVIYIAGEGRSGVVARFDAWQEHHKKPVAGVALRHGIPLNIEGSAEHVIAEVRAALRDRDVSAPAMIIVDTLKRNFSGDQNASKDMSVFVRACDTVREAFPDSTVVVVNHSGHAEKERMGGSIDLLAAVDAEFKVEKKDGTVVVTNTNMKDAEEVEPFAFEFTGYDLSHGRSAAVLVPCDAPAARVGNLTGNQRLGIETLKAAGEEAGATQDGPWRGVALADWRREFYRKHTGATPDSKKSAFDRVRSALQGRGLITVNNDLYMLSAGTDY